MKRRDFLGGSLAATVAAPVMGLPQPGGQLPVAAPRVSEAAKPFVTYDAPVIAIQNVRVIDGTGCAAAAEQTVVLRDGLIAAIGAASTIETPKGAVVIDGTGKSLLPGLVQLHEHMWMDGPDGILNATQTYPRLYLAAGVTSLRTAGSYNNYVDLQLAHAIKQGTAVGPWIDVSVYMDVFGAPKLNGVEDTTRFINFWLDSGFTSVKAYRYTKRLPLKTAIDIAHRRGVKVTGHLCATTYGEAADFGIDNLEHGFIVATDFMPDRKPDVCNDNLPGGLQDVDPDGPAARALIAKLVAKKVALTSTLVTFAPPTPTPSQADGTYLLAPPFRRHNLEYRQKRKWIEEDGPRRGDVLVKHSAQMELSFMRAGGLLMSGTDPAVSSMGVLAGFASTRQMELMVENGFTPLEAIRVGTLNGAVYLNRDKLVGSVEVGKQADLMLVDGDPSRHIADIAKVTTVFKEGIGFDSQKLRRSVAGTVGYQ